MADSILESVKKSLGLESGYAAFDSDIVMHINSVLSTLAQLGVGPPAGVHIEDNNAEWSELLGVDNRLNMAKSYIYAKVRLLFDPPSTSFGITALEKVVSEWEWRLNVQADKT